MNKTLRFTRGDDLKFSVRWLSGGVAVPFSAARLQIRKDYDSDTTLADLTPGAGLSLSTPGQVDIHITPVVSRVLSSGVWDLEVVLPDGQTRTISGGRVIVDPDVTRG